jgi:hypothetical protein
MLAEISNRCDKVEECYEFLLAYAAQGLPSDQGSRSGAQVREFLLNAVKALTGLAETCAIAVKEEGLEPADKYLAFFAVLDRDARRFSCRHSAGSGPTHNQFPVDRQSECFHPSPRSPH